MIDSISVCIGGSTGYLGQILIKLVSRHPYLKLAGILAKETHCYQKYSLNLEKNIPFYSIEQIIENKIPIDLLLLATPPTASIEIVTQLKNCPFKIIDLSGAFRLSQHELIQWYGITHQIPKLMNGAAYGLSPWGVEDLCDQNVLANPGCYATCALLSLIPLLRQNVIQSQNIIIDAKSGISGAGRKENSDLMFVEMVGNFFPYKIGKHQHIPEIKKGLAKYTTKNCEMIFVSHMLPIKTGLAMSIYANANALLSSDKKITQAIEDSYQSTYSHYPFVKWNEINKGNATQDKFLLSIKNVVGTPNIHIGYFVKKGKIMIFSAIDNLLKGGASQVIENINSLYHFPLKTGLDSLEEITV